MENFSRICLCSVKSVGHQTTSVFLMIFANIQIKSRFFLNKIINVINIISFLVISVVPPSQTAPETVSLLQQQSPKLSPTIIMQTRSGYTRDKSRPRITQYCNQLANNNQYPAFGQTPTAASAQYLQPGVPDNKLSAHTRAFKMPSPPIAHVASHQV